MKRRILKFLGHLLTGIIMGAGVSSCAYQDLPSAENQTPDNRKTSFNGYLTSWEIFKYLSITILLMLSPAVHSATPGLPFTETFDTTGTNLQDINATTANWSTSREELLLNFRRAQSLGLQKGKTIATDISKGSTNSEALVIADFNGDDYIDYLTGDYNHGVHLYLNNQSSDPFDTPVQTLINAAGGLKIYSVASGDIDRDGDVDIVVSREGDPNIFYLNNGSDTPFTEAPIQITTDTHDTVSIALADIDNNGYLDVIALSEGTTGLHLYMNSGPGTLFSGQVTGIPVSTSYSVSFSSDLVAGDIDNDNDIDIVVSSYLSGIYYYTNDGDSSPFDTAGNGTAILTVSDHNRSILLGDVDGNGSVDIVTANGNLGATEYNKYYLNSGTSVPFTTVTPRYQITSDTDQTRSAALLDADSDGDLDFIAVNRLSRMKIYLNNGSILPFNGVVGIEISEDSLATKSAAVADLDRDGDLDLFVGTSTTNRAYENTGSTVPFSNDVSSDISPDNEATQDLLFGDIDNDGDIDLVHAGVNVNGAMVNRLYLNSGTNNPFAGVSTLNITDDTNPGGSAQLADMNRDGLLDLIVGNVLAVSKIYLNDGANPPFSTLLTGTDIGVSPADSRFTNAIAIGDVDNDGDLDLVQGNFESTVSGITHSGLNRLYLNNGTLDPFNGVVGTDFGIVNNTSLLELADMNNDGRLDLLVGNGFQPNQASELHLNNGTANPFSSPSTQITADIGPVKDMAIADFNRDGFLDVFMPRAQNGLDRLYINDTIGDPFDNTTENSFPFSLSGLVDAFDIDRDGLADIVAIGSGGSIVFYKNQGPELLFSDLIKTELTTDVAAILSFGLSDFDNDGDTDIAVGISGINRLHLDSASPEGFNALTSSNIGISYPSRSFAAGDVNNDGKIDLVSGLSSLSLPNLLFLNNGSVDPFLGVSAASIKSEAITTYDVKLADTNNDGKLDLITANNGTNRLYLNDGNGDPFDSLTTVQIGSEALSTIGIAVGDINRDGYMDVVTADYNDSNHYYLNNKTATPFSAAAGNVVGIINSNLSRDVTLADFNQDGYLDLAVANQGSFNSIYLHNQTPNPYTLVAGQDIRKAVADATDSNANSFKLDVGDINQDGLPDIVVGNFNGINRAYLNNGTATPFTGAVTYDISADSDLTQAIKLDDLDQDGDLDVIAASNGKNKYYINNGGGFSDSTEMTSDLDNSHDIVTGDFNGNGKIDVLVSNNASASKLYKSVSYDANKNRALSLPIDGGHTDILKAVLTPTQVLPSNTSVDWYLSNDGGAKYYRVTPGAEFTFPAPGDDLRWKAELHSLSPTLSPIISQVDITGARFDHDQDLIADDIDLCVGTYDPLQLDADMDAVAGVSTGPANGGDLCDADDDNDGVLDVTDLFPFNSSESADTDSNCGAIDYNLPTSGDGCGDATDGDIDGDGILNADDPFNFNVPPNISGIPPTVVTPDTLYPFAPSISDGGDGPGLTVSLAFSGGNATNLPAWLGFDGSTGALSGIPSNDDYGVVSNIVLTVDDGVETRSLASFNINVIDTRAPITIAAPATGDYNADVTVSLACFDLNGAGCAQIRYTTDAAAPLNAFSTVNAGNTSVVIPASGGVTTLRYYSVDAAATPNTESVNAETYTFDAIAPVVSIGTPGDGSILAIVDSINGSSSDSDSGIVSVELQITDGTNAVQTPAGSLQPGAPVWIEAATSDGPWSYDTTGLNWVSDTIYTLNARATDAAGNQTTVTNTYTFYNTTASATTLTLSLTDAGIHNGGTTDAFLTLTRLNNPSADLTGVPLELHILKPDTSTEIFNAVTNFSGNLTFTQLGDGNLISFDDPGQYQLVAKFTDTVNYPNLAAATSQPVSLLVGSSAGYAVIVQGKLPGTSDASGLASHNKTANRIYDTLKDRGFVDQDIFYYNFDQNQVGVDDLPSKAIIQMAIESLADEIQNRPAPVYLIMVDHGGKAIDGLTTRFFLDDEIITPADIDTWLGNLESDMNALDITLVDDNPRVVIIGSCYSGGFIDDISAPNRIIITSATDQEQSFKGPTEDDNIRVGEYFLEQLFQNLGQGLDLRSSFKSATLNTEQYTRSDSEEASANSQNEYFDTAIQHPLLDDDGIGSGANELFENSADGQLAKSIILGVSPDIIINDAFNPASVVEAGVAVSQDEYLANTETTRSLELIASDPFQVNQAYVEIRKPSFGLVLAPENTTEQQSAGFIRRAFNPPQNPGEPYKLDYDGFDESGKFELFYYVNDRFTGALSPAKRSVIYKNRQDIAPDVIDINGINDPPVWNAGDLLTPADNTGGFTLTAFDWEDATDPEGHKVTYNFFLADSGSGFTTFSKDIAGICTAQNGSYIQRELTSSSTFVDKKAGLCDQFSYVWKVEAVDQYGLRSTSSIFTYNTDDTNFAGGVIVAMVRSNVTQAKLSAANLFNSLGEQGIATDALAIQYNGNYVLFTDQANAAFTLSAEAAGYLRKDVGNVSVNTGETAEYELRLESDGTANSDADTFIDSNDNCPLVENQNQNNNDLDAAGDACDPDDDNDGMSDAFETLYGLAPFDDSDAVFDKDGDTFSNLDEFRGGTDPTVFDAPSLTDTDDDGLFDNIDNCPNVANASQADNDVDSVGDLCDSDDDNDGMPDSFEVLYLLDPFDPNDAIRDPDGDGLTNLEEYQQGSSPIKREASTTEGTTVLEDGGGSSGGAVSYQLLALLALLFFIALNRRRFQQQWM